MDVLSFEELVAAHYNTLLRIAVQQTGNRAEAEDIVQETFLKLLETGRQFHAHPDAKAFLIRMTVNRCRNYLKSARHTRNIALTDEITEHLPDSGGFGSAETDALMQAMQTLRPEYRNVIYLYYYEEYSIKEIAAILRKRSNTVSSWLTRARNQLKEVLRYDSLSEDDGANHAG